MHSCLESNLLGLFFLKNKGVSFLKIEELVITLTCECEQVSLKEFFEMFFLT